MTSPEVSLFRAAGTELDAATLYELAQLRERVFVVEQACPYQELDGNDLLASTRHLWLATGSADRHGRILAYLRVLAEPADGRVGGPVRRIGRVCTARSARGSGFAGTVLRAALAELGGAECVLDAQVAVRGFYARFGFTAEGEEFLEDGIPHITMRRPAARYG